MPNFKILDGDIYVSKSGNDTTGDGSMATPFASIQRGVDAAAFPALPKIVVGSGEYIENVSRLISDISIVGDGLVLLNGTSIGGVGLNLSARCTIDSFSFLNYTTHLRTLSTGFYTLLNNCNFKNGTVTPAIGNGAWGQMNGCLLINSPVNTALTADLITNSTFINSPLTNSRYNIIRDCHFDATSNITMTTPTHVIALFDYNNVQGLIDGQTFNDYKLANPQHLQNSISVDPLFNLKSPEDFTLSVASPNRFASSNGKEVGARKVALSFDGLSTQLTVGGGATLTDITVDGPGNFTLTSPATVGTILSAPIDLGRKRVLDATRYDGVLSLPQETLDFSNTADNPNKLTYRLKWADTQAGLASANLIEMEWNVTPSVDGTGKGNGELGFDPLTEVLIQAQWVIIEITMRSDGVGG